MSLTDQLGCYRHLVPPHIMHNQAHSLTFPSFQLNMAVMNTRTFGTLAQFTPGSQNSLVARKVKPKDIDQINGNWIARQCGQDLKPLSSAKDQRPKYKTLRPTKAPVQSPSSYV
ncbi:hypothetical protein K438DRAFT_1770277 [Mycena galopus ATCC 62051]|nr:hypothetical protein K438DRAFT_1770277 [Mycena galopus ATCC 62051]